MKSGCCQPLLPLVAHFCSLLRQKLPKPSTLTFVSRWWRRFCFASCRPAQKNANLDSGIARRHLHGRSAQHRTEPDRNTAVVKKVTPVSRLATPSTLSSSPPRTPRKPGSRKTIPKALRSSIKFWSEPLGLCSRPLPQKTKPAGLSRRTSYAVTLAGLGGFRDCHEDTELRLTKFRDPAGVSRRTWEGPSSVYETVFLSREKNKGAVSCPQHLSPPSGHWG